MILLALFAVAAACLPIAAPKDQITAADLARALPGWAAIPPDLPVALAPVPGVRRILHIVELRRLATRFGVTAEATADLCFQRPVAAIPAERMLAAMQASLPQARIEILEPSRVPAPEGELDFPLTGLRLGYWYGAVRYGAGHHFSIWARVSVKLAIKRIVAAADLKPGQVIERSQLRFESLEEIPTATSLAAPVASIEDFAGLTPLRSIAAGTVVQKQWLVAPRIVTRGDTVKVEVVSGSTRLVTEGIAEGSGVLGETISVQNPESKRYFRARIEGEGRVLVKGTL